MHMYVFVLDPNNKMYIHGRDLYFLQNVGFSLDDGILEINIKFAEWEKKSRSKNVPRSTCFSHHISRVLQLPYREVTKQLYYIMMIFTSACTVEQLVE